MEQYKKKAESILDSVTSYVQFKELNGIPRGWFVECIAKGLQELATQPSSAPVPQDEEEDDIYDAVRKFRDKQQEKSAQAVEEKATSKEADIIYRIVEQWGNALCPMNEMEKWLKEYAASATQGAVETQTIYIGCKWDDPEKCGECKIIEVNGYSVIPVRKTKVPMEPGSQRQAGMVWVKAANMNEVLIGKEYFYKFYNGKADEHRGIGNFNTKDEFVPFDDFANVRRKDFYYLEILDESTPSKEDAVEFATFLFKDCQRVSYNTLTDVCQYIYKDRAYSTEQLYDLFKSK